jgi:hypothetical protein
MWQCYHTHTHTHTLKHTGLAGSRQQGASYAGHLGPTEGHHDVGVPHCPGRPRGGFAGGLSPGAVQLHRPRPLSVRRAQRQLVFVV